jgi:hypothetical protein
MIKREIYILMTCAITYWLTCMTQWHLMWQVDVADDLVGEVDGTDSDMVIVEVFERGLLCGNFEWS